MTTSSKSGHALDALLRRMNGERKASDQLTRKNLLVQLRQEERYDTIREQLRKDGYAGLACSCKVDRVVLTTRQMPWEALIEFTGCRNVRQQRLWNKPYGLVSTLSGLGGIRQIRVEQDPKSPWLAPFRVSIIPRDDTGLPAAEFRGFLESVPGCKIVLIEIALDFPINSIVDVNYVRAHFLSGKMRLQYGSNAYHQRCGRGTYSRTIRAYVKWEAAVMRLELELHAGFLRRLKTNDTFDFQRLADAVARRCVLFAVLDRSKVVRRLVSMGVKAQRIAAVSHALDMRVDDLWESLRYLRQEQQLKNVRRFLTPLSEVNQVVDKAIEAWAAEWLTALTGLRVK